MGSINGAFDFRNVLNKYSQKNDTMQIVFLNVYELVPNPKNKFSMEGIERLAAQIEYSKGVKEPLRVKRTTDGRYMLISGHRRREAVLLLLDSKSEVITSPLVPVIIEIDEYESEDYENYSIAAANEQREKTLEDKEMAIKMMKPFVMQQYEELRKQGKSPGRFRAFFAEKLGLGSSELGRIEAMENLAPELRKEIDEGNFTVTSASKITSLPHEEQVKIYNTAQSKGKVTGAAIEEAKKEIKSEQQKAGKPSYKERDEIDEAEIEVHNPQEPSETTVLEDYVEAYENLDDEVENEMVEDKDPFQAAKELELVQLEKRLDFIHKLSEIEEEEKNENYKKQRICQISILEKLIKTLKEYDTV